MNISNDLFNNSPIHDMKEFIENQQYREDQLRHNCHLSNFLIEPKKNLYHQIYDDIKYYITDTLPNSLPYPMLYNSNEPIICTSFDELIHYSFNKYNINRELIYDNKLLLLKSNDPPQWSLKIDN